MKTYRLVPDDHVDYGQSHPADDEATIDAICSAIGHRDYKEIEARAILSAIRRGEVPGLTTTAEVQEVLLAECNAHAIDRDALEAEVERLREDVTRVRKLASEDAMKLQSERDAAIARAENLQFLVDDYAEHHDRAQKTIKCGLGKNYLEAALDAMDTAIAMADEAEKRHRECARLGAGDRIDLTAERDTARAAHAEAMKLLVRHRSDGAKFDHSLGQDTAAHIAKHQNKDASK